MDEKRCENCQYFRQHYILDKSTLLRVHYGHCVFANAKGKRTDAKACENFEPGAADEDAFVTKTYLSKAILEYVFKLELLPVIQELPAPLPKRRKAQISPDR